MKLSGDTNEWVVFDPAQCYVEPLDLIAPASRRLEVFGVVSPALPDGRSPELIGRSGPRSAQDLSWKGELFKGT